MTDPSNLKYEWVCVGCERLIDGPDEARVHASVQTHKRECLRWKEWQETTGKYQDET